MSFAKVTAIVRPSAVATIEARLKKADVPGMSVSVVKGYGDYADFFRHDWMVTHVRIEVFIAESRAEKVAETIMDAAHTGVAGDGLVAIAPVSRVYHIRSKKRCDRDAC